MNTVILNGHVGKDIYYGGDIDMKGQVVCKFYVATSNPTLEETSLVPCVCLDWLAQRCYAGISEGCYVEIIGELVKRRGKSLFVNVQSMVYKKPKSKKQYTIRSTEFLQTYKPANIMKQLNDYAEKNNKGE
jgi:RecJ-like exonuclease